MMHSRGYRSDGCRSCDHVPYGDRAVANAQSPVFITMIIVVIITYYLAIIRRRGKGKEQDERRLLKKFFCLFIVPSRISMAVRQTYIYGLDPALRVCSVDFVHKHRRRN